MTIAAIHDFSAMEMIRSRKEHSLALVPKPERISLIVTGGRVHDWRWATATHGVSFVHAAMSAPAILSLLQDDALDLARVVVNGCLTAGDFLDLLASPVAATAADILWISGEGCGYLSAIGRGGDRVLYTLAEADVHFYLEVHELIAARLEITGTDDRQDQ